MSVGGKSRGERQQLLLVLATCVATIGALPALAADAPVAARLEGGRRIEFAGAFSSEKDVHRKRSFWNKLVDFVAGPPRFHSLVRPYGIATDSQGRVLVTDPGAQAVHIFDFDKRKYHRLEEGGREHFRSPIGVAVDGEDNIYVTDSGLGKIFVFDAGRKFRRKLGERGGEGIFKRPTGIALDRARRRIYLSDTLHHKIFELDLEGNVLNSFGSRGTGPGQFNFPTDLVLRGDDLIVVDSMNFRVQVFDRGGTLRRAFGQIGSSTGSFYRSKGIAVDSEGDIYIAEALFENVQIFDGSGQLLYFFGRTGDGPGEFQLPAGLWIDSHDRIYVADSFNRRVQTFQFVRGDTAAGAAR